MTQQIGDSFRMELEFRMSVLRTRGLHVLVKGKKEEEEGEKEEAATKIFTARLQKTKTVLRLFLPRPLCSQ